MQLNKKHIFLGFILVVVAQLFVPAKMIYDQERIIALGKEFKFKTRPIDPNDPFRGKYITLRFDIETHYSYKASEFKKGDDVYVLLRTDEFGMAAISDISKVKPGIELDYVVAQVNSVFDQRITINYPFNRYYMEESKAQKAEDLYREASRDSSQSTYAIILVRKGNASINDVVLNGESIKEIDFD
jgi:uncharacterized membrane-anchored protein